MGWFSPFYGLRSGVPTSQQVSRSTSGNSRAGTSSVRPRDWGVKKRVDREAGRGRRRKVWKSFVLGAAAGFGVGMLSSGVGTFVAQRSNQVWAMLAGIGTSVVGTAAATKIGSSIDGLDYKASAVGFGIGGTLGTATYLYGKFPTGKDFWKYTIKGTAKFILAGSPALSWQVDAERYIVRNFVPGGEWAINTFDELVGDTLDYVSKYLGD